MRTNAVVARLPATFKPVEWCAFANNLWGSAFIHVPAQRGQGCDRHVARLPLEQIQHLCGRKSKTVTEKYVKARWQETATPNMVDLGI